MKEVSNVEAVFLHNTHTVFWESNIKGRTDKAFRIKVLNSKGAWTTVWVPKSKTLFTTIPDPNPGQQGKFLTKYLIPKYFTK